MIHPAAWLTWVGAILVALSMTRNPIYLGLILLWLALVGVLVQPTEKTAPIPISPWRFGLIVVGLSALFNALTVHFGSTVLFTLPDLPVIGGPITLEAITFGLLNGLTLAGIFAAFTILNQALPVRAIVRLIPRAFYPVAVVISIALTFVPATLRHLQQIREAQAVRGHRLRGLRDWLPLFMPLLVGGLERALQLAEAMTARGFAGSDGQAHPTLTRAALVGGLVAVLSGWLLRLLWGQALLGGGLLLGGIILIGATLWWVGRQVPRTIYRPQPWLARDWLVALCAGLTAAAFLLPLPGLERASIFYYPYPTLLLPEFNPLIGAATAGLLGPIVPTLRTLRLRPSSPERLAG